MCKFKQMVCIALIVLIFEVVLGGDVLYGQSHYLYVGTYTAPNVAPGGQVPSTAEGIYVFKMDQTQSALELIQVVTDENPSFLAVDPTRNYLYCVNELGADHEGSPLGRVSAYKINQSDGTLRFINTQLTNGTWPCHIWVHPPASIFLRELWFRYFPGLFYPGRRKYRRDDGPGTGNG
jgi:hypothetical protein